MLLSPFNLRATLLTTPAVVNDSWTEYPPLPQMPHCVTVDINGLILPYPSCLVYTMETPLDSIVETLSKEWMEWIIQPSDACRSLLMNSGQSEAIIQKNAQKKVVKSVPVKKKVAPPPKPQPPKAEYSRLYTGSRNLQKRQSLTSKRCGNQSIMHEILI